MGSQCSRIGAFERLQNMEGIGHKPSDLCSKRFQWRLHVGDDGEQPFDAMTEFK